jgi:hypothetical protein
MASTAFFQLRGTPTAMLSAIVCGSMGLSGSPLRKAVVTGAAPAACAPSILGVRADEPQRLHFVEGLPHAGDGAAVAHRHRRPVGNLPRELLADFQPHGLLALDQVWIDGAVAVVPTPTLAGALGQLKRVLVAAAHAQDGGAENAASCVTLGSGARSGTKMTLRNPSDAAMPASEEAAFPVLAQATISLAVSRGL